jgi:hypothetical protein
MRSLISAIRAVLPGRSKTVLQMNDATDEIVAVTAEFGVHGDFQTVKEFGSGQDSPGNRMYEHARESTIPVGSELTRVCKILNSAAWRW